MKGIIFNLAEEVVSGSHGQDTWDDVLDRAGLDGSYTSLGSYPDDELHRLVRAAAEGLEVPPADLLRQVGLGAMPLLAERFPRFFTPHRSARSFVLTLNDIIHPEVRKLYPGADAPEFGFDDSDPATLVLTYDSARKLCALAEGFLLGAAHHYRETVDLRHERCMHDGAPTCVIHCRFVAA
jgi:hypothetical protein